MKKIYTVATIVGFVGIGIMAIGISMKKRGAR